MKSILIVDDNHDVADSLAQWLSLAGHRVKTVYTGEAALEELKPVSPEIVLLDIGLPDINGYEVAAQLRLVKGVPPFVLVAVTGYGYTAEDNAFKNLGFDHFFAKPLGAQNLETIGIAI